MKKQSALAILLVSGALLGAMPTQAAESGWYAGVSLGRTSADIDVGEWNAALTAAGYTGITSTADDTDTGLKLMGGYQFSKNFAVEFGYIDLGEAGLSSIVTGGGGGTVRQTIEGDGWQAVGVGILPLSESFSVFGKLGVLRWNADATTVGTGVVVVARPHVSDSGTDMMYGLGASYSLGKNFEVRAEWERFNDVADSDVDLFSVGAVMRF